MQKILVRVEVARVTAIRAGKAEYGRATVALDPAALTPEQRESLLSLPRLAEREEVSPGRFDSVPAYELTGRGERSEDEIALPPIPDTSIDSIRLLLDAVPAAIADREKKKRDRVDRAIRRSLSEMRVGRRYQNDEDCEPQIEGTWIGEDRISGRPLDSLLARATPELAAQWRARHDAVVAEYAAEQAAFEQRRAARRAARQAEKDASVARSMCRT